MGLGKRKDAVSYTPLVKFDARNGQMTRCDRIEEDGGWVTKAEGRKAFVSSELLDPQGNVLAESNGLMVRLLPGQP